MHRQYCRSIISYSRSTHPHYGTRLTHLRRLSSIQAIMRIVALSFLLAATLLSSASGFTTPSRTSSSTRSSSSSSTSSSRLHVLPPPSPETVTDLMTTFSHHHYLVLADAAAAATADAATQAEDAGWWAAYLNIFKTCLLFVHNTIDAPLKSVGWDQTWGPSIAIFTASVRSLLIPISLQQSKSSEYVKALKPYMTEIKEKFKDNKDAQNRAVAKLYEDANQNPLAGCFVSLAQLPIFLGLYRGVRLLAIDGELDEPFLFIPSLQGPVTSETDFRGLDWLTQNWQQVDGSWVPSLGWETTLAFMIMPVLLVLGQSLSMNVLTPPMDDSMGEEEREQMEKSQKILKFLPLLIGFFSLQVPAGLTIYWFTSNFFTLAQSLAVKAYYQANPPKIELPDYWDALEDLESMSPEEKRQAAQAGITVGPKWEDLLDEAQFHVFVERPPLRTNSMASTATSIPMEFQAWVDNDDDKGANSSSAVPDLQPATATTSS